MRLNSDESFKNNDFYIVSGCGDDSAMMIAECYVRGYEPKAIVFCDTGNEMPHTYKFLAYLSSWMMSRGWSKLVVLKKTNKDGKVIDVFHENYKHGTMPPPVYGFKTCSQRFKTELANRWIAINEGYGKKIKSGIEVQWKNINKKIIKAVGINADEEHRISQWKSDDNFEQVFPLVDWDIGEKESSDTVCSIGLYMPGKSSCFMCPNMTAKEIVDLHDNYPLMFYKAIAMERNVVDQGNDIVSVKRVFAVDRLTKDSVKIKDRLVKKVDRKISIDRTLDEMPKKTKIALGLEVNDSQLSLLPIVSVELEVREVIERTNFVGLGRTCSWMDVISEYKMTGQVEMFRDIGGQKCSSGACGS